MTESSVKMKFFNENSNLTTKFLKGLFSAPIMFFYIIIFNNECNVWKISYNFLIT